MKNLKIGYDLINKKILVGKAEEIRPGRFRFIGEKQDVTDDAVSAVAQLFVGKNITSAEFTVNNKNYVLSVEVKECEGK